MMENRFSTSLYNVCKQYMLSQNINIDNVGYDDIINTLREIVFGDYEYNIYDNGDVPEHKRNIEELFVSEYLFDDLGVYSFGEWYLHFRIAFQQTIEKFNPIWKINDKYSDYLFANNVELSRERNIKKYGKKTSDDYSVNETGTQTGSRKFDNSKGGDITKSKNVYYDTPMDEIDQPAYTATGETFTINGKTATRQYATNMTKDENEVIRNSVEIAESESESNKTNKGSSTLSGEDTDTNEKEKYGLYGDKSYFQILNEMRETFFPLDIAFVKDDNFKELFSPILL